VGVHVKEGKVVKIEGDPQPPFLSGGMICPKGMAYKQITYHPDRLKYPLKRVGERGEGKWQRISWDEALDTIADKLGQVREKYGPESIALTVGGNHKRIMAATKILADSLGTPNWAYTDAFYCRGPGLIAQDLTFGGRVISHVSADCKNSECVIAWGANPVQTYPPWARHLLQAKGRGAKVIVIDPRLTATASKADMWLQLRPGTDGALALGMLNVIINEGLYDKQFVDKWCVGFEELRRRVQEYPPERAGEITWVPADEIKKAARVYAATKPASLYVQVGPEQIFNSTQSCRAICCLIAITGNLDVKGGNIFPCFPKGALMRIFFCDRKWRFPDEIEEKRLGAKEFPLLSGPSSHLGVFHSPTLFKALVTDQPYPVKAMVVANNLLLSMPNTREVYEGLKKLDFLMVEELFMTPTAELADIVLPIATWLEVDEVIDCSENVIAARQKAVEPVGECWDELKITYEIANRMGLKFSIWPELKSYEEYEEFRLRESGITLADLKETYYVTAPMEYKKYERDSLKTPSGKVELYSSILEEFGYDPLPHYVEPIESPFSTPELAIEYPLILITGGRQLAYFHSMGHQVPWLRELVPDPVVQIHPETAEKLGIKGGDWVWIETPQEGRIKQKAELTLGIDPRVVHCMAHWWYPERSEPDHGLWESNMNVITSDDPPYEPICGTCPMRGMLCKIYKVTEG